MPAKACGLLVLEPRAAMLILVAREVVLCQVFLYINFISFPREAGVTVEEAALNVNVSSAVLVPVGLHGAGRDGLYPGALNPPH